MDGETQIEETVGNWFKCRLPPRAVSETQVEGGHRQVVDSRQLSGRLYDETGALVSVSERDRLEIQLGASHADAGIWEVTEVMVPRGPTGADLLLVIKVTRREEH